VKPNVISRTEQAVVDSLARQMTQSMDRLILDQAKFARLTEQGWTLVNIDQVQKIHSRGEWMAWCVMNTTGAWDFCCDHLLFETADDAVTFSLVWI
jgi:hypothetical protein